MIESPATCAATRAALPCASRNAPPATGRSARVALVEDEPLHAELYSAWLAHAGFKVATYDSGRAFRRNLGAESADLVVLDWTLPDTTGVELLHWLKASPHAHLPVVFLTGNDSEADLVTALHAGAEDYVAKPARMGELLARLNGVLKRHEPEVDDPAIVAPPFRIEPVARRVYLHDEPQELTDREHDLLVFLFRRSGRIVSRELLLAEIWNVSGDVSTRTIDTHIWRLRRKLGLDGESGWRLSSVYQHGYRLEQLAAGTRGNVADAGPPSASA